MGATVVNLIICILWGIISLIIYIPYIPLTQELSESNKRVVAFIFLIGGPFFAVVSILESILDNIFPDGWEGDK